MIMLCLFFSIVLLTYCERTISIDITGTVNKFGCECNYYDNRTVTQCQCFNNEIIQMPVNLSLTEKLVIIDSNIKVIRKTFLDKHRERLVDIEFINVPLLEIIEPGTFANIPKLRTLYISYAANLKVLTGLFTGITTNTFQILKIIHTGLHEIPDLHNLPFTSTVSMLDLDHNKIEVLPSYSIKVKADQVSFNFNKIAIVENFAFNGSEINQLKIRGNRQLKKMHPQAFVGIKSLTSLDLSETSIESIPTLGLSEIESLRIERTPSLKTIPSVYEFVNLKEAMLTHPFHCCAFIYPEHHHPNKHAEYQRLNKLCRNENTVIDTGQIVKPIFASNKLGLESREEYNSYSSEEDSDESDEDKFVITDGSEYIEDNNEFEMFHNGSASISNNKSVMFCGRIVPRKHTVSCTPVPNALNPCEDIMGSLWLRVSVWFVVVLAVLGNSAVIIVVIFSGGEITVARFLICNLAIADFCMGLYLLMIASMDLNSVGTYFNFAFKWQYGFGCQMAGFLTVFASHLSIFTLTVVTIERWYAITYAIHLTKRIRLRAATRIMIGGWLYSVVIALLPFYGVSNYSSTSICLPMEVDTLVDKIYLYAILLINGLAFLLIVFCYAQIYFSLGYETRHSTTKGEMTIAKKMALLIFTDFATWAPIAFFGLTALAGYPLIGVTRSKILLVFFYPLNACANPYLYAIMTAQYRNDFLTLVSRCGFCKKNSKNYTLTTIIPASNNSQPIPLLARINDSPFNNKKQIEDSYV